MNKETRGYFLLDTVLATLILSILLSAVLLSLQTSLRGFQRINESLFTLYIAEKILYYKFLLSDKLENRGSQDTPYGQFVWTVDEEEAENFKQFNVLVKKEDKIYSDISSFMLKK